MRLLIFTLGLFAVVRSQCPDPPEGQAGICVFTDENCLEDSECSNGQICCSHLCGKICKDKVKSEPQFPPIIDPPACPIVDCFSPFLKNCQYGYRLDRNGCQTCECKSSPCEGEAPMTLDSNGNSIYCGRGGVRCPTNSECKIHPADAYAVCCPIVCPPVCEIFCPNGNVLDKNGCKTCTCKECPEVKCAFCLFGYKLDKNGCKTCECKVTPCEGEAPLTLDSEGNGINCGRGGVRCPTNSECKIHPADRYALCCPIVCPPVCAIFCPNGNVLDERGCATCDCKKDPSEKPGTCPSNAALSCFVDNVKDTCSNDNDCPGNQKCCDLCGKTCSPPDGSGPVIFPLPLDKQGSCPVPPSSFLVRCAKIDRCKADSECPGTLKCCDDPCGRQCKDIVKSKPGVCPISADPGAILCERRGDDCYQDSVCPGTQKCCQGPCGNRCVDSSLTSTDHKGTCPALDPNILARIFCVFQDPECELDTDCKLDEKCCQDYCGIKCVKSQAPIKIKSGSCPVQKYQLAVVCASIFADKCAHDGECPGNEKCCKSGCVKQCVDPETSPSPPLSKPGSCRRYRYRCRRQQRNFCSTDNDCRGSRKCCKLPCGKRCRFPRRTRPTPTVPSPIRTKGCPVIEFPPFVRPLCSFPITPPCKVDGDCSRGEICCPGSCFNRCLKAPKTEVVKSGDCPTLQKPIPACFRFQNDCRSDGDCSGDQKCCKVACGIGCASPVKTTVCPANPCGNAAIKCQYGQVKDENGCFLCKCNQCPNGEKLFNCLVDPCTTATCSNPAGVRCVANYCGGCNAVFYDSNYNKVDCSPPRKGK